jgi:hypothetical protein
MKTCLHCIHFDKCKNLMGAKPTWTECDFIPSRFSINTNWIDCDKHLPPEHESVIVLFDTPCIEDCIDISYLENGLWHNLHKDYEAPKYWIPIPELPTDTDRLVLTEEQPVAVPVPAPVHEEE